MNVNLKEHYGLYIGGKFVPASDGKEFETTNPPPARIWPTAQKPPGRM